MKLSVIIVNYNGKDMTLDCLESIYSRLQNIDFEIFLVDNASNDETAEAVSSDFPEVNVIANKENLGFSRANNQGIREAKGDYILLLNNDTLVESSDIDKIIDYMQEHKDVGILGCRINNPDGSLQLSCYRFPGMWEMISHYTWLTRLFPDSKWAGDYRNWAHDEVREVDFVIGAFFLIKKEVLDGIGLLDEKFFLNAEEAEFCLRAKKAGWKRVFYPDFTIIHLGGQTKETIGSLDSLSAIKGTDYLIRKHHNIFYYISYKVIAALLSLVRLVVFGIAYVFTSGKLREQIKRLFMQAKLLLGYELGLYK